MLMDRTSHTDVHHRCHLASQMQCTNFGPMTRTSLSRMTSIHLGEVKGILNRSAVADEWPRISRQAQESSCEYPQNVARNAVGNGDSSITAVKGYLPFYQPAEKRHDTSAGHGSANHAFDPVALRAFNSKLLFVYAQKGPGK